LLDFIRFAKLFNDLRESLYQPALKNLKIDLKVTELALTLHRQNGILFKMRTTLIGKRSACREQA
jgi:hypothetical protein